MNNPVLPEILDKWKHPEYHPWYVVRHGDETSQGFDDVEKAILYANAVETNPDVTAAVVLRARRVHTTKGKVIGRTAPLSIYDHTVYKEHGQAMAVYASVKGDHNEPLDLSAIEEDIVIPRTDAQKSAWAKSHPQCFPFHRNTRGVN